MKKKVFTRPVCIMVSPGMYQQILELTEEREIWVSDYIRAAIQEKLTTKNDDNYIKTKED